MVHCKATVSVHAQSPQQRHVLAGIPVTRLVLSSLLLLAVSVSFAASRDEASNLSSTSQKLRDAEQEMQDQLSWLRDYIAVYTALDNVAAQLNNRLPDFNVARVNPLFPVASADYLISLPNPLREPSVRIRLNLGITGTATWPQTTILGGSLTLRDLHSYERSYDTLTQLLPGVRQKIGELDIRIRTMQTLLNQPDQSAELTAADSGLHPGPGSYGEYLSQADQSCHGTEVEESQPPTVDAAALVDKGYSLSRQARLDEAHEMFDQAVRLAPAYSIAYYGRGSVAAARGNWEGALADFSTALSFGPSQVEADVHYSRGCVFLMLNKDKEAIRDLQVASSQGHHLSAQVLRYKALKREEEGMAHFKKGLRGKAINSFSWCIEFDPSYPDGYFNRGLMYEQAERHAEAIADFESYLTKCKYVTAASDSLSTYTLFGVDKKTQAELPDLDMEIDIPSVTGTTYYRIGFNHHKLMALGTAVGYYSAAIEHDRRANPSHLSRDHYSRAKVLYEMGRKKEALRDLRRACELGDADCLEMKNELADELGEPR